MQNTTDQSSKKIQITLTSHQAGVLNDALDLYSRIHLGQLQEIIYMLGTYNICNKEKLSDIDDKYLQLEEAITQAKSIMGFTSGASYGIHSLEVHDNARVAYDTLQIITQLLAYNQRNLDPKVDKRSQDMIYLQYDDPFQTSTKHELPKGELIP